MVWGLYYVVFLIFERLLIGEVLQKLPSVFTHTYSIFIIIIGWVFFRADDLSPACYYIQNMFLVNDDMWNQVIIIMNKQYWFCLLIGILFSVPWISKVEEWLEKQGISVIEDLILIFMFLIAISYLLGKGFSPFLYFRF